jgi:hypothetical protein
MDMDTDTDSWHGTGHQNLISHHPANFEIGYQSQFIHCAQQNQPTAPAQYSSHTVPCSRVLY